MRRPITGGSVVSQPPEGWAPPPQQSYQGQPPNAGQPPAAGAGWPIQQPQQPPAAPPRRRRRVFMWVILAINVLFPGLAHQRTWVQFNLRRDDRRPTERLPDRRGDRQGDRLFRHPPAMGAGRRDPGCRFPGDSPQQLRSSRPSRLVLPDPGGSTAGATDSGSSSPWSSSPSPTAGLVPARRTRPRRWIGRGRRQRSSSAAGAGP
jgi:hypothetical protein